MKASVYVSPFNRTGLIDDNVTIVSISPLPKLKKNGDLVMYRKYMSYDDVRFRTLYTKGIRVADVVYNDGTQDSGVWVNIQDIRE